MLVIGLFVFLGSWAAPCRAEADEFERSKEVCLSSRFKAPERIDACTWLLSSGQLATGRPLAFHVRGVLYKSVGNYSRALVDFTESLGLDRGEIGNYAMRGETYYLLHEYDRCIADYNSYLRVKPGTYKHWMRRGYCRLGLKEIGEAANDLGRAAELCEESGANDCSVPVVLAIAELNIADRRFQGAEDLYGDILKEAPQDPQVLNALAWFRATAEDSRFRNGTEAIRLARRAIGMNDNADFRDTLAAAHAELGQFDEAVRAETEAIRMMRENSPQRGILRLFEKRVAHYRNHRPVRCPSDLCE